jgi:3-oxoacyl-[acyl-carrier protein] reductase
MNSIPSDSFHFGDLNGRTLLITGITRGIGRALLPVFLAQGMRIVAVSRGMKEMQAIRESLGASEEQLRLFQCDLADREAVTRTGKLIADSGIPIDGILHNAAIDPRHWFEKEDDAFWLNVMQVNLFAAVSLTRHLLPVLRLSDQGRILFTGSVISELGGACLSAYAASKGAILGVVGSLAHELAGSGITVNCIIPGAISVEKEKGGIDQTLIGWQSVPRRLTPMDLAAQTCLFLSKWGGGISGQAITIDGGLIHPLASVPLQGRSLPPK